MHHDIIGESLGLSIDQVFLLGNNNTIVVNVLFSIEYSADILRLVPDDDNDFECDHDQAHDDSLDIDPEDLATVPSVEQVVTASSYHRQVYKSDLEQSVPVHPLVVLHAVFEACKIHWFAAHARVLEPEELEGGQHCESEDHLRCARESGLVLVVELILADKHTSLKELIEDAVAHIAGDKSYSN